MASDQRGDARKLALLLLCALPAQAATVPYDVRPAAGSTFVLEVYKTGLWKGRKHVFLFNRYSGAVQFDPDRPEESTVRFVVEAGSIINTDTWVTESDRKKVVSFALHDMMAAEQYPQLVFVSKRIVAQPENHYEVQGELTVRGMTKPATVQVAVKRIQDDRFQLEGTAQLKLSDYGLKPPSAALGMIGTRNEMDVRFLLVAEKRMGDSTGK